MYGMRLSQLTGEVLKEILLIYDKVVGGGIKDYCFSAGSPPMTERLKWICEGLDRCNAVEFRYGSKLKTRNGYDDQNAKLFIWREGSIRDEKGIERDMIIRFSFDPNLIEGEEAEHLTKEFEKTIDYFLFLKGLVMLLDMRPRQELEEAIEKELKETANNWAACFITQLMLAEFNLSAVVKKNKIEKWKEEKIQSAIELLKLEIRNLMNRYPSKEPLPPAEERERLLDNLAILKTICS